MTHTPGPWRVDPVCLAVLATNAKIGGDTKICDIRGWGYLTGHGHGALGLPEDEARAVQASNAHLIAAAPAMLEALRGLVKYDDDYDGLSRRLGPLAVAAIEAARAAIKQAEGGNG